MDNIPKADPEAALAAAKQVLDRLDKHELILAALVDNVRAFAEVLANHNAFLKKLSEPNKPLPPDLN